MGTEPCAARKYEAGAVLEGAAAGMAGFELDVQPTRDGTCMLLHDEDLARMANGSGQLRHRKAAELPPP
jgi:glycerophosphoryl diester phosphodiesterase